MKKFVFRLDRVLEWRRTQERMEKLKLERLHADRLALEARWQGLEAARGRALQELTRSGPVTGFDLETLDGYRKSVTAQAAQLTAALRELDGRTAAQMRELAARRRDVRLVERLREQTFHEWHEALSREVDREAEEVHILKLGRA